MTKERLRQFILEFNSERDVTVLITSHDMHDLEKLCSRVIIIERGRLAYDGSFDEIRYRFDRQRVLAVEFEDDAPSFELPHAKLISQNHRKRRYEFDRYETNASNLLLALSEKGYPIVDAGQLVPLWLFPESLRTFAQLLPFRSVYSIPLAIYIGRSSSAQMVQDLWFQLFWVVVLFSIGHFLWNRVHARLVVQGG